MDLRVHRVITYLGLKRAYESLGKKGAENDKFMSIWMGNWMTDMNQASGIFSFTDDKYDSNKAYSSKDHKYHYPDLIKNNEKKWEDLFKGLWNMEKEQMKKIPEFKKMADTGIAINNFNSIGCYYPYDHFDVVDGIDEHGEKKSVEYDEFNYENSNKLPDQNGIGGKWMTKTAYHGVYQYCLEDLLQRAYYFRGDNDRENKSLYYLGRATHTLQDFFAHSNFIELLLSSAIKDKLLDENLVKVINMRKKFDLEKFHYTYYKGENAPQDIPIMTGRFDTEDTIVTLMKVLISHLMPQWQDLKTGGLLKRKANKEEIMFNILFGTFSDNVFAVNIIELFKQFNDIKENFESFINNIGDAFYDILFSGVKLITDDDGDKLIDDMRNYMDIAESKEAQNYAKAGKLSYVIHVIEKKFRKEISDFKPKDGLKFLLPHHTLLAKDSDPSHPFSRLKFKLAALFATEMTGDLHHHYFSGEDHVGLYQILPKYFCHPSVLLDIGIINSDKLKSAVDALYGRRWWLFANNDINRVI